jgi:hypothetical protein
MNKHGIVNVLLVDSCLVLSGLGFRPLMESFNFFESDDLAFDRPDQVIEYAEKFSVSGT